MRLLFMGIGSGWREILAHKLRSFLTLFGIVLGTASLVCMLGVVKGMLRSFETMIYEWTHISVEYDDLIKTSDGYHGCVKRYDSRDLDDRRRDGSVGGWRIVGSSELAPGKKVNGSCSVI